MKHNLTNEEKLRLTIGKGFMDTHDFDGKIKSLMFSDGPQGVRQEFPTLCYPSIVNLASTWNIDLAKKEGESIACDCIDLGIDCILGPGMNIKRTPLCGRNFEYVSEDPFLTGHIAKNYVLGVQSKGVASCIKHFACNNREQDRNYQSSEVDDRTLREIYLTGFEIACEAKPWMAMCSYNPINGIYAAENKYLLTDILRNEFKFDGLIVSDWGAVRSAHKSINSGLDLIMPVDENFYQSLVKAQKENKLDMDALDRANNAVFDLIERTNIKNNDINEETRKQNAYDIALESFVLLKNDGALPLHKGNILFASPNFDSPRYCGLGSGEVKTKSKIPFLSDLLKQKDGYNVFVRNRFIDENATFDLRNLMEEAYNADTVLVYCETPTNGESTDRKTLKLAKHYEDQIKLCAKYNKNVVVLIYSGSAVDCSEWIDDVNAVLYVGYAGEKVNDALIKVLTGEVSPSGKLCETWPYSIYDTYTELDVGEPNYEIYSEGIFVGYRYFDKYEIEPMFPFGYGLSYANFEYSNLKINKISELDYEIKFDITNKSNIEAKEVAELYVSNVFAMVSKPIKELKGFAKVNLKPNETKTLSIKLNKRSFAYYSVNIRDWYVENGNYEILIGASSKDIRLKETIKISLDDESQFSK